MKFTNYLLTTIALLGLTGTASAENYANSTPAVQGYDVVSYYTGKRPIRGNGNFVAVHKGTSYQFSSSDNQKAFQKNPGQYLPAYGGYCAFGASVGKKFICDPEVWRIVDGRLYLNLDTGIQVEWLKDIPGRIKAANNNWTNIKDKDPASL